MALDSNSTNMSLFEGWKAATTAYVTAFEGLYVNKQPGAWELYASKVANTGSQVLSKNFASNFPQMREMKGTRVEKFVRTHRMDARLKTFESTLKIDRKIIQYAGNDMGMTGGLISSYLAQQMQAYDQECYREFYAVSGVGNTCFDGLPLFSTAHVFGTGGATWSNYSSGTNLNWTTFEAGRKAMRQYLMENGEPAGMKATALIVGPALETTAREICKANERVRYTGTTGAEVTVGVMNATAITNVWAGEIDVIVDSRLVGTPAYYWTLVDLSKPGVRPIELYEGMAPTPQIMDSMTDNETYSRDKFTYGVLGDYVSYPGHPLSCYRGTGTAVG